MLITKPEDLVLNGIVFQAIKCDSPGKSYIQKLRIVGNPFIHSYTNTLFIPVLMWNPNGSIVACDISLSDRNIPEHSKSWHRMFTTEEGAK